MRPEIYDVYVKPYLDTKLNTAMKVIEDALVEYKERRELGQLIAKQADRLADEHQQVKKQ